LHEQLFIEVAQMSPYIVLLPQNPGWVPVAHTYNPTYSGEKDQKHQGARPYLKNN
jgi:hypothetical protein